MAEILRFRDPDNRNRLILGLSDSYFRFDRISRMKSRRNSKNAVIGGFLTVPLGKNAKEITIRGRYYPAGIYSTPDAIDGLNWYERLANIEELQDNEVIVDFINLHEGRYLFHKFTHDADRYIRMFRVERLANPSGQAPLEVQWVMESIEIKGEIDIGRVIRTADTGVTTLAETIPPNFRGGGFTPGLPPQGLP